MVNARGDLVVGLSGVSDNTVIRDGSPLVLGTGPYNGGKASAIWISDDGRTVIGSVSASEGARPPRYTRSPGTADGVARQDGDMRLVITADTHVPKRARDLPPVLWSAVEEADVVIHAGDWVDESLLDRMLARSRRLIGVYGNNDGPALRARLPEVARVELAGLRVAVVHETGGKERREQRCAARFPDSDLLVFGHSHIPWTPRRRAACGCSIPAPPPTGGPSPTPPS